VQYSNEIGVNEEQLEYIQNQVTQLLKNAILSAPGSRDPPIRRPHRALTRTIFVFTSLVRSKALQISR
jgi:hypothetical protein